ncbi:hypothetical protein HDU97_009767 [Phlyctochytrium planicorne]|nr:hypothetical protein HDU97_009767 [Phlyctochytrium planicorne]
MTLRAKTVKVQAEMEAKKRAATGSSSTGQTSTVYSTDESPSASLPVDLQVKETPKHNKSLKFSEKLQDIKKDAEIQQYTTEKNLVPAAAAAPSATSGSALSALSLTLKAKTERLKAEIEAKQILASGNLLDTASGHGIEEQERAIAPAAEPPAQSPSFVVPSGTAGMSALSLKLKAKIEKVKLEMQAKERAAAESLLIITSSTVVEDHLNMIDYVAAQPSGSILAADMQTIETPSKSTVNVQGTNLDIGGEREADANLANENVNVVPDEFKDLMGDNWDVYQEMLASYAKTSK